LRGEHDTTAKARHVWDRMAPRYDRSMRLVEKLMFGGGREWVCSRATGRVLEVAVGTGLNFAFYPPGVAVTAIEISPAMLARARARAARLGLPVTLCEGDGQALPFASDSFDSVVCTLSLCNIPDETAAIAEMARVLRPGGRLLLLDHVASRSRTVHALQRLVERFTIPAACEHFTRRPKPLLPDAGLQVVESERLKLGMVERVYACPEPRDGGGAGAGAA
jgi:ubiquinone/menaquinone biosynthesis C-methylase UbiE